MCKNVKYRITLYAYEIKYDYTVKIYFDKEIIQTLNVRQTLYELLVHNTQMVA